MIRQKISHYEIVELLGEGGMGVVYKARDSRLDREVAIKFLTPHAVGSEDRKRRFVQEARAAASLNHPSICTVHDIDESDGRLFIVMEYVEGITLKEQLRSGPLSIERSLAVATDVARGLAVAHERGIVHRDIKSGNVMLSKNGRATILDFGLAKWDRGDQISDAKTFVGTPANMSPEQIRGEALDARADVWSFGVLLHEMLTARLPFARENVAAVIHAVLNSQPEPLSAAVRDLPPWVERLARKAVSKDPAHRYRDARALLDALESGDAGPVTEARISSEGTARSLPSIAVLAFSNLSADGDQEYFCDGIAEEIINRLAHVSAVQVASRTSSFAFKGKTADIRTVGTNLGVRTVLEGSVRKVGNRLRITCQLIDVANGYHLWSEQYDRELEDVFAIQEEIAQSVVAALELELTETEEKAIQKVPARNVEAYEFYLRGRQFFYRSHRKGIEYALEMFSRAVEKDPNYGCAHAGMADCYSYRFMYFGGDPADLAEAEWTSRRALEIDADIAEAHASCGLAISLDHRYAEAELEFEEAIRLNPRLFEAYYFYARTCYAQGKATEAAELYEKASEVNPEDFQALSLLAFTYVGLGRQKEALSAYRLSLEQIDRHLEMNPDDARAYYLAATAQHALGREEECWQSAERALSIAPDDPYNVYGIACLYSRAGQVEEGIRFLEKAVRAGFAHVEWIEKDTDLEILRNDSRFRQILDRLRVKGERGQSLAP